eukprot:5520276-Pyramimonas_sp.AAC.1
MLHAFVQRLESAPNRRNARAKPRTHTHTRTAPSTRSQVFYGSRARDSRANNRCKNANDAMQPERTTNAH